MVKFHMEFSEPVGQFLKEPNFMVLSTLFPDGSIQSTIVWFKYTGENFLISTVKGRVKYKNLVRDPKTTLVIYDRNNSYRYVQVKGVTESITESGAHKLIDDLSLHYVGLTPYHGDPDHKQERVVISIKPTKYFSVGFDKPII